VLFNRFSRKVAFRYLFSRRAEAFISIITYISILGVAIGVIVLTVTMAIMTGFETVMREAVIGSGSHIVVRRVQGPVNDWRDQKERIEKVAGVSSVSAFTLNQALIRVHERSSGILVRGVEQESEGARLLASQLERSESINNLFEPQKLLSGREKEGEASLPGIIIGRSLARNFGIFTGTPITILSSDLTSSPFGLVPRFRRFATVGNFSSGFSEYESSLAYISLVEAQRFFEMGDVVTGLDVRVFNIMEAPVISQRIMNELGGVTSGFYTQDWTETHRALWEAIELEKRVYFIVLLLIVVMASFSIITTLVMIVLEKRKDIAVMRTMGATSRAIGDIFRLQGAIIGAVGTILGVVLGYVTSLALREYGFPLPEGVFPVSTVPVQIEFWNFVIVGLAAFAICCLATIYPSWRASKLNPVDMLRYE
jgi:lipoprotein-releasing system permease protein